MNSSWSEIKLQMTDTTMSSPEHEANKLLEIVDETNVDWEAFLARHLSHPEEARSAICGRRGPLRWLLRQNPPEEVLKTIVKAHREEIFSAENQRHGRSALLQSCILRRCGPHATKLLLREDPSSASQSDSDRGRLPLHYSVCPEKTLSLLRKNPSSIETRDLSGNLPLHCAARSDAPPAMVQCLIERGKKRGIGGDGRGRRSKVCGGVMVKNSQGKTPFHLLSRKIALILRRDERGRIRPLSDENDKREWQKFIIMTRSLMDIDLRNNKRAVSSTTLVHKVIELRCAPPVIEYAALQNCSSLSMQDSQGRTPLWLVASDPSIPLGVIDALLDPICGQPTAASVCDHAGSLPLHAALANGRAFDDGIGALIAAEPRALRTRDTDNGLYPFMINTGSVDTIYRLLRSDPGVLKPYVSMEQPRTKRKSSLKKSFMKKIRRINCMGSIIEGQERQ